MCVSMYVCESVSMCVCYVFLRVSEYVFVSVYV